jgi:hypothetical protein
MNNNVLQHRRVLHNNTHARDKHIIYNIVKRFKGPLVI